MAIPEGLADLFSLGRILAQELHVASLRSGTDDTVVRLLIRNHADSAHLLKQLELGPRTLLALNEQLELHPPPFSH